MLLSLSLGECRGAGLPHGGATFFLTQLKGGEGGRGGQFPQCLSGEGCELILFLPVGPGPFRDQTFKERNDLIATGGAHGLEHRAFFTEGSIHEGVRRYEG